MNEVDNLLKIDFLSLKFEEQLEIKKLGPHQPRQFEHQQTDKAQTRWFSSMWFDKIEWLTVSLANKTFFCFYCLLFGGGDTPWSKAGYRDLKHLSERMKKHESSIVHINNAVRYKTFGVQKNPSELDTNGNLSIYSHNEMVHKNRLVLDRIVNCIKFCGSYELPICGHDIQKSNLSRDVFLDLLSQNTSLDNSLDGHSKSLSVSQHTSKTILDELLYCMYHVYKEELKRNIENANFVSLEVDEISDVPSKFQFSLILRFVKDGMAVERFHSLLELPCITAADLGQVLKNELKFYNIGPSKLIAQAYDTTAIIDDLHGGIQSYMRGAYPRAQFIHCYAHEFSLILKRICSRIKNIKSFFVNVSGFASFFSSPYKHIELLKIERGKNREDENYDTNWSFQQKIVSSIYENQVEILACLEKIQSEPGWDDISIRESARLTNLLNDKEFFFFLDFFYNTLQHIEFLYSSLQPQPSEDVDRTKALQEFEIEMAAIRDNLEILEDNEDSESDDMEPKSKRLKKNQATSTDLKIAAKDAWDMIVAHVKDLFETTEYTAAFSVVDPKHFKKFNDVFPNEQVQILSTKHPTLNSTRLVNELGVLYKNETFAAATSVSDLLKLLMNSDLVSTFTQVSKLLEIVLTIPVVTDESERCFDTLKRTKAFLRNTRSQDKLNALTVLAVHRDVIEGVSGFNNMVIDRFASEKRRTQYIYK